MAEALTRVAEANLPDAAYAEARARFSEAETADLALAVAVINGWNGLAVALHATPLSACRRAA